MYHLIKLSKVHYNKIQTLTLDPLYVYMITHLREDRDVKGGYYNNFLFCDFNKGQDYDFRLPTFSCNCSTFRTSDSPIFLNLRLHLGLSPSKRDKEESKNRYDLRV